jgi:hypothetical protein
LGRIKLSTLWHLGFQSLFLALLGLIGQWQPLRNGSVVLHFDSYWIPISFAVVGALLAVADLAIVIFLYQKYNNITSDNKLKYSHAVMPILILGVWTFIGIGAFQEKMNPDPDVVMCAPSPAHSIQEKSSLEYPAATAPNDLVCRIVADAKWYERLWMRWTVVDWLLSLCAAGTAIAAAVKNGYNVHVQAVADAAKERNASPPKGLDNCVMILAALTVVATVLDGRMHASQQAERYRMGDLLLQDAIMDYRGSQKTDDDRKALLSNWHRAQDILEGNPRASTSDAKKANLDGSVSAQAATAPLIAPSSVPGQATTQKVTDTPPSTAATQKIEPKRKVPLATVPPPTLRSRRLVRL